MPSPLDPQPPLTPRVTAQRLLVRELGRPATAAAPDVSEVAAAGERLVARVTIGLARSFGPYGAHALLARALVRAQASHPVLTKATLAPVPAAGLTRADGRPSNIVGLPATTSATDAMEGVTAWLTQLADLLGGLIGDDLAATLLEQSAARTDGAAPASGALGAIPPADSAGTARHPNADAPPTVDEP
jgi:hypothetical protein